MSGRTKGSQRQSVGPIIEAVNSACQGREKRMEDGKDGALLHPPSSILISYPLSSLAMTDLPRGILFDMDGTLTEPMLDFALIRADMGLSRDRAILEAL